MELFKKGENPKQANISLVLDTYDDIFSDFDPRPYHERALSDDFLQEMKRASRDKPSGELELNIAMPKTKRNLVNEHLIRRRLLDHFRKHYDLVMKEHRAIKRRGLSLVILGVSMLVGASYLASVEGNSFWFHLLLILLEPGGWFTGWTGLDQLFYTTEEHRPDVLFYQKMTSCEIEFSSY